MVLELEVNEQTLEDVDVFSYMLRLNEVNESEFSFAGTTEFDRTLFTIGNEVKVFRDGNLDFLGDIVAQSNFIAGQTKVRVAGREVKGLGKQQIDTSGMTNSGEYVSTTSSTIYSEIVNQSTIFSLGTVDSPVSTDFKANKSNSLWNSLKKLVIQLGQEIEVDYDTLTINIKDALGASDVFDFKENVDVGGVKFDINEPIAKKVVVYGSGSGASQIVGSAQSGGYVAGDRVETITDLNIKTIAQANERASAELSVLEQDVKLYDFRINDFNEILTLGDSGTLDAISSGADDESVRVTEIRRGKTGDAELLSCQVANLEFNRLIKQRAATVTQINQSIKEGETSDTTFAGNSDLAFANAYNVNNATPLLIPFTISSDQFSGVGTPDVGSFSFDYDLDPFKRGYGSVLASANADVSGSSSDNNADVAGTSDVSVMDADFDSNYVNSTSGASNTVDVVLGFVSGDTDLTYFTIYLICDRSGVFTNGFRIQVRNLDTASTYFDVSGFIKAGTTASGVGTGMYTATFVVQGDIEGDQIRMTVFDNDTSGDRYGFGLSASQMAEHDHTDGTYGAVDHPHLSGTYDVNDSELESVLSIGDTVSDAGSVDATSVDIYVDFWNGASWINKHSILATGNTIDTDVDLSNGGTLPDAFGQWRVRMLTNQASGDYGQGVVRLNYPN